MGCSYGLDGGLGVGLAAGLGASVDSGLGVGLANGFAVDSGGFSRVSPPQGPFRTAFPSVAEEASTYQPHTPAAHQRGEVIRLAMALIEGARVCSEDRVNGLAKVQRFCAKAVDPGATRNGLVCSDEELGARLMQLARQSDRRLSAQLELLVRFADAELYQREGCRSMAQWMDVNLGMGRIAASEHLRVGRALRELPMCGALFALGKLSYSKARVITRHATSETDETFATATLDLSSSETEDWCEHYRHEQDAEALASAEDAEAQAALMAHDRRALRTRDIGTHTTRITLDLPKDMAAEFLRSLEQCDEEVLEGIRSEARDEIRDEIRDGAEVEARSDKPTEESTEESTAVPTAVQRRADAAVLMSRRSLAHAGEAVSMADRFRVHVTIDSATLEGVTSPGAPKPTMDGTTPVSSATVRRLAELAGFTAYAIDDDDNPVASKRIAAPFSKRQLRALRARDGCCQMPGCGATRHLDGHHVVPRSEGGSSTLDNAVLLCGGCHRLLHEGGYSLQRETVNEHSQPADRVRRYRLFGADGVEYGSRGAALRRDGRTDGEAKLFPQGNMEVHKDSALH